MYVATRRLTECAAGCRRDRVAAWVIYRLGSGEVHRVGACATLEAAKAQVERVLPDGEWRHGYRDIWDYVVEHAQHRRVVAFRVELQAVATGGGDEPDSDSAPAKFTAQANAADPSIFERFTEHNFPECFKEYADLLTWDKYWHTASVCSALEAS